MRPAAPMPTLEARPRFDWRRPERWPRGLRVASQHLALIALYGMLAIAGTYPLITRLASAFPGTAADHDVVTFIWNIWWTRHALLDLHTNPLQTDIVFAPHTVDLRLHTYGLLYGVASIPFQLLFGVLAAFNLLILATAALNGYAVSLLVRQVMQGVLPSIVAGAIVVLNPTLLFHLGVGRPSFAAIWPVALAILFLLQLAKTRRLAPAIGLGLALACALFLDFQVVLFSAIWLVIVLIALVIQRPSAVLTMGFGARLMLAALIAGVPFASLFAAPLVTAGRNGYPVPSDADTLGYSYRWWDFVTPSTLHFTFGALLPAMVAITALCLAWRWRRANSLWFVGGALFLVLSLGVKLQPYDVPLPFWLLRRLPGVAQFRTPYRLNVPATLGFALAFAGTLSLMPARPRLHWLRFPALLLFLCLLVLDSRLASPFEVQTYPDQPVYQAIAQQAGDFVVLEVPLGLRSGTDVFGSGETLQYYQMMHGHGGVNGMVARVPTSVFDYYRTSPSLRILAGELPLQGQDAALDFSNKLDELKVGFIVVHPAMLTAESLARVEALVATQATVVQVFAADDIQVYAVGGRELRLAT